MDRPGPGDPAQPDPHEATAWLKSRARQLGFDQVGVAPVGEAPHASQFLHALNQGWLDPMPYLKERVAERCDPRLLLPGAQSVVMVLMGYHQLPPPPPSQPHFKVARYAARRDYHLAMVKGLRKLRSQMKAAFPGADAYVAADTGAVAERDWAHQAGLGWVGKSGMLLSPVHGTWTVLGAMVTTLRLIPDAPMEDHCGSCSACLAACPTGAIVGPRQVDARRCISTWNVEWRGDEFPADVPPFHGWVFGCDVCQEVCPYQKRGSLNPALRPRLDLAFITEGTLRDSPRLVVPDLTGTPLARAGVARLVRNARAR